MTLPRSTTVIKGLHNPQIDIKVFSELIKNSLWPSATSIESLIVYNIPGTVETEQLIGIKPHRILQNTKSYKFPG